MCARSRKLSGLVMPSERLFTVTFPCSPTLIFRLYINVNNPIIPDNKRYTIMLIYPGIHSIRNGYIVLWLINVNKTLGLDDHEPTSSLLKSGRQYCKMTLIHHSGSVINFYVPLFWRKPWSTCMKYVLAQYNFVQRVLLKLTSAWRSSASSCPFICYCF